MATLVSASRNYAASANDGSPDSVAYSASVTAGNLLVVVIHLRENSALVTGVSGVGAAANGAFSEAANRTGVAIYYKANCAGGAETAEVSFSAASNFTTYIDVLEFAGIATASALDQSSTSNPASSTTVTWPALSATGAGLVIAAAGFGGNTTKSSLTAGYTAVPSSPANGADSSRFFTAYRFNTGAETTNAAVTLGTSSSQYLAIANFLDASGSSPAIAAFARGSNIILKGY